MFTPKLPEVPIWGFDYNFNNYCFRRNNMFLKEIPCQRGEIQGYFLMFCVFV